jgi:D-beta-D-heptose 7-phosphate kinase/D-beta-D-heptose 1-phosphate adenosyltransferase
MSFDFGKAAAILCAMQSKTVLVVGDIMLDRFVDGDVTRISPEAPVPVLGQTRMQQMPGGAANVATNLARLGVTVHLIGVCGDDAAGDSLIAEINRHPAIAFTPIRIANRLTSVKTRYRAAGQQILRVDDEVTSFIDETAQAKFVDIAMPVIKRAELVIISDYGKGSLPSNLLKPLIKTARTNNKPVIVDPKLADLSAYSGANLLTPNLGELRNLINFSSDTIEAIGDAAALLAERHGFDNVLTTLSARGMLLSNMNGERFHDPASARDVFDVSGAGDTVIAVLGGAMAAGADIHDAVRLANHAAGVVVGKSGTATAVAGEILAHMGAPIPVTDWQSVARLCFSWREQGQTIAFANGCFDLLHPGHIHLLQKAAALADHLVVGLNSDRSVRRLKGDSRPLQPADVRSAVLASLDIVDAVALFEEDTPHNLISLLQPDFIVKGGDYHPEDVIGADIVAVRGGKVVIVPTLDSHSTSNLLKVSV